ncbi:MAG: murein biosynthesis integral membrane protein MurJ [Fimbriimonadaceae bacterium]|nr:murein biosynthesis integral membrane protein MurJ [Fimbriimonadaceae bacterium]
MSTESNAPNVGRAGTIMVLSLFLSRILGLVRESVMSGMFGASGYTDAYVLSFSVPDLLFFLIAGGALSSAFIPVFSEYWHTDRKEDAWKVFSSVVTIMALVITGFVIAAEIFAPQLSDMIAAGKLKTGQEDLLPYITHMSRILLPAQLAFFIGGILFGTLYVRQIFAAPGLGPNIYNLGIIGGAVIISHFVSPGIIGMAWGALIGAVLGNLVIPLLAMRKLGSSYRFSLDTRHDGVRKVFKLMLPVILGLSLPGVFAILMRFFGAYYEEGVNTWLNYANQLMQAPLGIFGQSLAIAVFPALSQFFAQGQMDLFRHQLAASLRTTIYLSVPSAALLYVMAVPVVSSFFEHGKFHSGDTAQVAMLLGWFAIGIPAWCMHPVLMRGFFAAQKTVTPIILGTLTTGVFIGLVFVLKATALGYAALPLASSLAAIVLAIGMLIAVKPIAGGLDYEGIAVTFAKACLAALVAGAVAFGLLQAAAAIFGPVGKGWTLAFTAFFGLIAAWAFYYATKLLKMPEAAVLDRAMKKLDRKGR